MRYKHQEEDGFQPYSQQVNTESIVRRRAREVSALWNKHFGKSGSLRDFKWMVVKKKEGWAKHPLLLPGPFHLVLSAEATESTASPPP